MSAQGPLGMREITNGAGLGEYYFAMQGARLFAIVKLLVVKTIFIRLRT